MNDQPKRGQRALGTALLLASILLVGGYLRFTGLNWDEGQWIHPDEGHMRMTLSAIRMPDSLSLYFDTHNSPLNVRNSGGRYSYGTLPLFLTRLTAEWLDRACGESPDRLSTAVVSLLVGPAAAECGPGTFTGFRSAQVGRALSALADLGTVFLIYLIGRRLYGETTGLLAAGLGALTAFSIQQAHFFTVDSMACFFTTLTVYLSVRAGQSGDWLSFGLAGLATGLAMACKVDAALASLLVVLAAVQIPNPKSQTPTSPSHTPTPPHTSFLSIFLRLVLAGLLALVAFRIAQPYVFEGPGFFGVRPSPEWLDRLDQIRVEQSGEADLPWGRQWTNRAPILFPWINMVVWGMGLPLGLAAWAGWAVAGFELWRGKRTHLIPWVWVSLVFLYQATRWVKAMRYSLSLYPIFIILAAYLLMRLVNLPRGTGSKKPGFFRKTWFLVASHIPLVLCVAGTALWASAVFSIYQRSHTRLAASRWIYAHVPLGATVANEHYDWGVPLRIDGHDPFNGMYNGFEMQHYNEDTWEKRTQLFDWLDEADYVFMASNRLYGSIARLPARYPLTTEYYRALFAGELGFELAADFTSRPAFGPFQFPDQENPFPLMEAGYTYQTEPIVVRLPPAEEAFSVYDHPRVLIFRKTDGYSRQRVEEVLGGIDVEHALHGLTPRQATGAPENLLELVQCLEEALGDMNLEQALEIIRVAPGLLEFDSEAWADQQAGGTWAEMFDRDSLLNRYPALAAVAWWAVVTVLGWLAFPLMFVALPALRDRGYGLARVLGLLLIAYLTWLAASLRVLPNTRSTIVYMVLLLALAGGGVGWFKRAELSRFLRNRWRLLLLTEGLFALLYVVWIGARLLHPDLWHPIVGGEKPMVFAYLNAVMKSTWFPPYNPWFSGSYVNYYYFGFVIVGTLIKLLGIVPAVAYNLMVPLLFALTGVGAFSVAYNLFDGRDGREEHEDHEERERGRLLAGVTALGFTVLLGNLGVVRLIRAALIRLGGEPFPSTIPGFAETVTMFKGLWQMIAHGATLALRPESWYWEPTRIIPAAPGEVGPISEFPAFTFLYADPDAGMISFSLVLLALAIVVYWARTSRPGWLSLVLGGLAIGALRPANTWTFPTFLMLGLAGLLVGAWAGGHGDTETRGHGDVGTRRRGDTGTRRRGAGERFSILHSPFSILNSQFSILLTAFAWRALLLIGLTVLLYLPYIQHYAAGYTSVEKWHGSHTPFGIYLWIHGILLFPLLTRLLIEVYRVVVGRGGLGIGDWRLGIRYWKLVIGSLVIGSLVVGLVLFFMDYEVALMTVPVAVLVACLIFAPGTPASQRLLWLMVGEAMAIGLGVEVIVLKGDIGRMNTVFKFYLQAWILLSVAAGVSLAWVRERGRHWQAGWRKLWWGGMVALILGGALFLPFGIRARAIGRMTPGVGVTLDGMAFMEDGLVFDGDPERGGQEIPLAGDYGAIRWMQDNIKGSPVILEGLGHREYLWCNRISIYTGLPAVIGWRWHQVQQRLGVLPGTTVDQRRDDVGECYDTTDVTRALDILARYDVSYVYVGEYERAYYDPEGLAKFDTMAAEGLLRVVYETQGVRIYEVVG